MVKLIITDETTGLPLKEFILENVEIQQTRENNAVYIIGPSQGQYIPGSIHLTLKGIVQAHHIFPVIPSSDKPLDRWQQIMEEI